MVEALARIERSAASARTFYARRVEETAAHESSGHRSAAEWLAQVTGEPLGQAIGELAAARRAKEAPLIEAAARSGELSLPQLRLSAEAGAKDPASQRALLASAATKSFKELKDEASRVFAAASSEQEARAQEARVFSRRYFSVFSDQEGGVRLAGLLAPKEGAQLKAALQKKTDELFCAARRAGTEDTQEHYRADALLALVVGGGKGTGPTDQGGAPAQVLLRVDAAALKRGELEKGEACEVAGVGPISLSSAKELLDDAVVSVVVKEGVDVRAVTKPTRTIPSALKVALAERDPICVVPGCSVAQGLEVDHWRVDFAKGGPTCLDNLARLCHRHHALKTYAGWKLLGGPGRWEFLSPEEARAREGPGQEPTSEEHAARGKEAGGPPGGAGPPRPRPGRKRTAA
jgi:hypothetical protein